MHPRSRHWHLIEFVITRRKDRQYVRVVKAMCGANFWTDHRHSIQTHHPYSIQKTFPREETNDVDKLQHEPTRQIFVKNLEDKLEDLTLASSDIDANWCAVSDVLYSTSLEHIGPSVGKHQDWFDQNNTEIQALLPEKDAYTSTRCKVQTRLR